MIRGRFQALRETLLRKDDLANFNEIYRSGPDLYFYKRVMDVNSGSKSIEEFLGNDYHLELLYATLVSWDMNSRRAKMEYFDKFKESILSQKEKLKPLWKEQITAITDIDEILDTVGEIYDGLCLMKTGKRLVSNSKALHFILPELLMPMDGKNTLIYFYNNITESRKKYLEIIRGSFELIREMGKDAGYYLDTEWNRTIPKVLDNAIILKNNKSIKKTRS